LVERISRGRVLKPSDLVEYCGAIQREADHLEQLVNRLLETHRIQSGQKRYNFAPHCVTDIAESVIARLHPHAEAKRITVALDSDDVTREIDVDRAAIHDALDNLLDNAIKYSRPDTHVAVVIRHNGNELAVAVRDHGIGIDAGDLEKVFDNFFRGQRGQAQSISGTGLGLTLVKAAAEGHGGSVEVDSSPGQGSEFRIRIPIRHEETYVPSSDRG
jgi:two-component system phosphate regulon sensor histidine kinase PhoR